MLDDLDTVAWAGLSHAHGSADDVPGLLRGLAEGEPEALQELYGNIWHQGTVYEASAFAVPFLVRILDAPTANTAGVLWLLASIANGSSYLEIHYPLIRHTTMIDDVQQRIAVELSWVAAAKAAVAAGMPTYLRLLAGHPDEDVRAATARTISTAGPPAQDDGATAVLRRIAADDASELVRGSVVLALGARGESVDDRLDDPAPFPRLAAAMEVAKASERLDPAVADVIERDAPACMDVMRRLPFDINDPLLWVVRALSPRWEWQTVLLGGWLRLPDADVRLSAAWACEVPMRAWRPAAALLVKSLATSLGLPGDDAGYWAANRLAGAGRAGGVVAEQLWAAVERGPVRHNTIGAFALRALSYLRDPRADAFLAARFSPESSLNLDGLREAIDALGPWAVACREVIAGAIERAQPASYRGALILAAGRVAAPLSELLPVLRHNVTRHPHDTTWVLGDLGPAAAEALPELTSLRHSTTDTYVRVNAARAIWRITGEIDDLLSVLLEAIAGEEGLPARQALKVLAEVGPPAASLSGLLPPMFDSGDEWAEVSAALAYWRLTGDAVPAAPVLIRHAECGMRGLIAVGGLAEMGPAAADAMALLREAVDSPLRRLPSAVGDEAIRMDEEWTDACADALAWISGS